MRKVWNSFSDCLNTLSTTELCEESRTSTAILCGCGRGGEEEERREGGKEERVRRERRGRGGEEKERRGGEEKERRRGEGEEERRGEERRGEERRGEEGRRGEERRGGGEERRGGGGRRGEEGSRDRVTLTLPTVLDTVPSLTFSKRNLPRSSRSSGLWIIFLRDMVT